MIQPVTIRACTIALGKVFEFEFPDTTCIVWYVTTTLFMVNNVSHTINEETNTENIQNIIDDAHEFQPTRCHAKIGWSTCKQLQTHVGGRHNHPHITNPSLIYEW